MTFFLCRQVYLAAILCAMGCGLANAEGRSDEAQLKGLTALTGAAFEPNLGQFNDRVDFLARGRGYAVRLRAGLLTDQDTQRLDRVCQRLMISA